MTITLVLRGPIARDDIAALCERLRIVLDDDPGPVTFDIRELAPPDAAAIEALARLQLTALRLGHRIRLRNGRGELEDLLALVGLVELLPMIGTTVPTAPTSPASGVEPVRQAEEREEVRRVQEERDPRDPIV